MLGLGSRERREQLRESQLTLRRISSGGALVGGGRVRHIVNPPSFLQRSATWLLKRSPRGRAFSRGVWNQPCAICRRCEFNTNSSIRVLPPPRRRRRRARTAAPSAGHCRRDAPTGASPASDCGSDDGTYMILHTMIQQVIVGIAYSSADSEQPCVSAAPSRCLYIHPGRQPPRGGARWSSPSSSPEGRG